MVLNLNGWRRLALALSLLWFCVAVGFTITAYITKENGAFVYQSIPAGTIVKGNTITPTTEQSEEWSKANTFTYEEAQLPWKNVTVTFADGQSHIYTKVPDDVTPDQVEQRAMKDFPGRKVIHLDRSSEKLTPPSATPTTITPKSAGCFVPDNRDQLYDALRKADAEGNTSEAKCLADYIRSHPQPTQSSNQKPVLPWDIDWSKQEGVTTTSQIRWVRLVLIGIAIPLSLWLLAELAVIVIRWIGTGFKKNTLR